MYSILWTYVAVASLAVWSFCYACGGYATRSVLTLGVYAHRAPTVAGYRPGSPTWARQQILARNPDHAARTVPLSKIMPMLIAVPPDATDADVTQLIEAIEATHPTPPASLVVHAELDEPGAEHWGTLLEDMTTEEREIHDLAMYQLHEEAMGIQRAVYARGDEWFDTLMAAWNANTEQVSCGAKGWDTAQWRVYEGAHQAAA